MRWEKGSVSVTVCCKNHDSIEWNQHCFSANYGAPIPRKHPLGLEWFSPRSNLLNAWNKSHYRVTIFRVHIRETSQAGSCYLLGKAAIVPSHCRHSSKVSSSTNIEGKWRKWRGWERGGLICGRIAPLHIGVQLGVSHCGDLRHGERCDPVLSCLGLKWELKEGLCMAGGPWGCAGDVWLGMTSDGWQAFITGTRLPSLPVARIDDLTTKLGWQSQWLTCNQSEAPSKGLGFDCSVGGGPMQLPYSTLWQPGPAVWPLM